MKIKQKTLKFNPITIVLNTVEEAEALFALANNEQLWALPNITAAQKDLLTKLSNAESYIDVIIYNTK